jgi:two-component system, cell cycle response regulator
VAAAPAASALPGTEGRNEVSADEGVTGKAMTRAPLVLLVTEDDWTARSLSSVLAPRGYAVLRAYNGGQALERAAGADVDAIFVSTGLPDLDGVELCRALREHDRISAATPILLLAHVHASREQRIQVLEAGAWDVVQLPLDAEELLLRLHRFVQGKIEAERALPPNLVDRLTGLYTREGAARRAREVGAAAERFGRPLACIVITAAGNDDPHLSDDQLIGLADHLRRSTRQSDVLARIGTSDFAVIAPDTPPYGAHILADRLSASDPGSTSLPLRAGVFAVADARELKLDPTELMRRATTASRGRPPD